ncbi:DUF2931 family protein, partial [Flavobacterium sp. FlaQc-30]|uniref:DUF2931 family protein n=1 Tax=Flavobacterium sp. FlaQc-30 TaxID=3374179 RepID=UPI003756EF6A
IVAGMAPGGNVTIWMQGGTGSTEICRFKAKNKGIWKENDPDYNKYIKEHRSLSDGFKGIQHLLENSWHSLFCLGERRKRISL